MLLSSTVAFASKGKPVVQFYGEASWPECQDFVSGGLQSMVSAEGVLDAINFQFFPWGNAYFNTSSCGVSSFDKNAMFCWVKECNVDNPPSDCFNATMSPILCQHGSSECQEDTVEGCAFNIAESQMDALNFLFCFEGTHQSSLGSVEQCAKRSNIDYQKLNKCANGPQGQKIDVQNAIATTKLGTSKLGTPWVLINGVYVENPMQLLESVCAAISSSPKPAGCSGI